MNGGISRKSTQKNYSHRDPSPVPHALKQKHSRLRMLFYLQEKFTFPRETVWESILKMLPILTDYVLANIFCNRRKTEPLNTTDTRGRCNINARHLCTPQNKNPAAEGWFVWSVCLLLTGSEVVMLSSCKGSTR